MSDFRTQAFASTFGKINQKNAMILIGVKCFYVGFLTASAILLLVSVFGGPWEAGEPLTIEKEQYILCATSILMIGFLGTLFVLDRMYDRLGMELTWEGMKTEEEDE